MNSLNKHFSVLLLSCMTLLPICKSEAVQLEPFRASYCSGDSSSNVSSSKEVVGSKIEISNMPSYKTQDELGECRAFSMATLVQKYTCDTWQEQVPDCANPPARYNISYFGMMIYTHRNTSEDKTFQPNQTNSRNMYDILSEASQSPRFILESCKPFHKLVNSFSSSGQGGVDKRDKFFDYLRQLYESKRAKTEAEVSECPECLSEISKNTGIDPNLIYLKKALSQDTYDKFLYTLFFEGCKLNGFADGFQPKAYPDDAKDVTPQDLKNKIIEGLKKGKPVMTSQICLSTNANEQCDMAHSVVLSGYRKCCDAQNKCKELFKVHNSWGEDWQKRNNNGWIEADAFVSSNARMPKQNASSRINSGSVIWLEP